MGHPAYRRRVAPAGCARHSAGRWEIRLLGHYAQAYDVRRRRFRHGRRLRAYFLGAQRATKILGIFARLDKRDGKPQYLAHLPRVSAYLRKRSAHPAMSQLRDWYVANLPRLFEDA